MNPGAGLRLSDLGACLEGVIPSIVATADSGGLPNLSYLSHVVMVDEAHVGLSNQFFAKTARNVRENPQAALLLVDGRTGLQYRLDLAYRQTVIDGPLFARVATQLRASSAQIGMADVMRLQGVDIYRVTAISAVPASAAPAATDAPRPARLAEVADLAAAIAEQDDMEPLLDTVLDGLATRFPRAGLMVLLHDTRHNMLTTIASRGYGRGGIGSEVAFGEGLIGVAASERRIVRIADMSRVRRFNEAVEASAGDENRTRRIPLPGLAEALSQIAVPLLAQGQLHGMLFAESAKRLAFDAEDEALFAILARQVAACLAALEAHGAEPAARDAAAGVAVPQVGSGEGAAFRVAHHHHDDSVFIDNDYVIKGLPGRLLVCMLEIFLQDGRDTFSNRELRLLDALRLPDVKDNLETRLLLLRRRLDEKALPVGLVRIGRGRLRLILRGRPVIERS